MIQDKINNLKITDTKIRKIIKNIEENIIKLSKDTNRDNQLKIIDIISNERNKYLTYYWASYIGYLKNIKDEKYLTSEKIIAKYEGDYNNAVYKFFETIDSIKEKDHIIKVYGKRFIDLAHNQKLLYSNSTELFEEELSLRKEYRKILNNIRINFNNEEISLVKLNKYLTDDNEQIRKEAYDKRYEALLKVSDELGNIFIKLLKVRKKIALSTNFKNYTDYSFIKMNRVDYKENDLRMFKDIILTFFVPLKEKLKETQTKRLHEKKLSYYNASYLFNDGNAKTKYNIEEICNKLNDIFKKLNTEFSELFTMMLENNLIDLEERENKSAGGITTFLPDFQVPVFIKRYMDNSNNFIAITHEFGHSLQLYLNRNKTLHENRWPTFDICEIHSTTMELLVSDYTNEIYEEDYKKHLITHYTNLIEILVRTAAVDDFQSKIYSEDNLTIEDVNNIWKDIYKQYYPTNNYDLDYFKKGILWQADINRIDDPFYGIDYALAEIYALSFYQKYSNNKEKGIKDFISFCKDGGEISFKEISKKYNLLNPFTEKDLISIAKFFEEKLEKIL
ncbi:MAG: hypothetical protein IJA30_05355 [Bacilli bacterium]|nr:hypothetical protein [Bacilli bacterium]